MAPLLFLALIHRSAWKGNSPKFVTALWKYNLSYRCTALGIAILLPLPKIQTNRIRAAYL